MVKGTGRSKADIDAALAAMLKRQDLPGGCVHAHFISPHASSTCVVEHGFFSVCFFFVSVTGMVYYACLFRLQYVHMIRAVRMSVYVCVCVYIHMYVHAHSDKRCSTSTKFLHIPQKIVLIWFEHVS